MQSVSRHLFGYCVDIATVMDTAWAVAIYDETIKGVMNGKLALECRAVGKNKKDSGYMSGCPTLLNLWSYAINDLGKPVIYRINVPPMCNWVEMGQTKVGSIHLKTLESKNIVQHILDDDFEREGHMGDEPNIESG